MTKVLITIFDNLSEIQKTFICFHLPAKFIKLSNNYLKQKLKNILTRKILKNKFILAISLLRWNKNINRNNNKFNKNYAEPFIDRKYNNNIDKFINYYLLYNYNNDNIYRTINNEKKSENNSSNKNRKTKKINNIKENGNLILNPIDYKNFFKQNNYINRRNNNFIFINDIVYLYVM